MDPKKLIKGKSYVFTDNVRKTTETVIYSKETLNHWVFIGETEEKWICSPTLKHNIFEIEDYANKME